MSVAFQHSIFCHTLLCDLLHTLNFISFAKSKLNNDASYSATLLVQSNSSLYENGNTFVGEVITIPAPFLYLAHALSKCIVHRSHGLESGGVTDDTAISSSVSTV